MLPLFLSFSFDFYLQQTQIEINILGQYQIRNHAYFHIKTRKGTHNDLRNSTSFLNSCSLQFSPRIAYSSYLNSLMRYFTPTKTKKKCRMDGRNIYFRICYVLNIINLFIYLKGEIHDK